jgi:hypothetical protein
MGLLLPLQQEEKGIGQLLQFYLTATESDKFLVLYVFIKLGLLQVNSTGVTLNSTQTLF